MQNCKILISVLALIVFLPFDSFGQADDKSNELDLEKKASPKSPVNLVKIQSSPLGATVQLSGLYSIVGRTPFLIPYPLEGRYKIKATKEGYESETSHINFFGNSESSIFIKLKPRTRIKAAMRSLVFPGWGQLYSGDKVRGAILGAASIGLIGWTLFAHNDYNTSQNALDRAVENLSPDSPNRNFDSFENMQNKLAAAQDDFDFRKTMLLITASFWAYNLIDSLIFFSSPAGRIEIKANPFPSASNITNNKIELSLKIGL